MPLNIFDLMKKTATLFFFLLLFFANGQRRNIPVDTIVVTNHTTTIKNQVIKYQAQAGTQPVWDTIGRPIATLFYTYYKRIDVKNYNKRPLIFSFNGGPAQVLFGCISHILVLKY